MLLTQLRSDGHGFNKEIVPVVPDADADADGTATKPVSAHDGGGEEKRRQDAAYETATALATTETIIQCILLKDTFSSLQLQLRSLN